MDRPDLYEKIKPIRTVYVYWLLFGVHYAYFGKWGTQVLYWITLGGFGIWAIRDFARMPEMIVEHREAVFRKIDEIENIKKVKVISHFGFFQVQKQRLALAG